MSQSQTPPKTDARSPPTIRKSTVRATIITMMPTQINILASNQRTQCTACRHEQVLLQNKQSVLQAPRIAIRPPDDGDSEPCQEAKLAPLDPPTLSMAAALTSHHPLEIRQEDAGGVPPLSTRGLGPQPAREQSHPPAGE